MAEALSHSHWRVSIDNPHHNTVFIQAAEFSNPVGKSSNFFPQVLRIIIERFFVELFLQSGLIKEDGTVTAMAIGRQGPCNDLEKDGFHETPIFEKRTLIKFNTLPH